MTRLLPTVAAAATGILVGAAIVATRFVIDQTSPATLALLRYTIGCACLLPVLLFSGRMRFERRDLLPIGLIGVVQFGISITLLNNALQYIPSARAALIFATLPLQTMLLAAILGHERVTWAKGLGVLLTIAGVGLALGERATLPGQAINSWIGELAALASATCAATCSVLYRPYLRKYPPLQLSSFAMLASVVFLALFATREGLLSAPPHFTTGAWLAVAFIGVNSGIGYYLWLWALSRTTATNVTVFQALGPFSATVFGALLLAEPVSALFVLGLACVGLGIGLAHWRPRVIPLARSS